MDDKIGVETRNHYKNRQHRKAKQVGHNLIQKQNENVYQSISLVTTDYLHFGNSFC